MNELDAIFFVNVQLKKQIQKNNEDMKRLLLQGVKSELVYLRQPSKHRLNDSYAVCPTKKGKGVMK